MYLPPADAPRPRIAGRSAPGPAVCRCGTRLASGGPCVEVQELAPKVAPLLDGRVFCTPRCVRAFFLEALSALEALDTPENERQVADLRETYVQLATTFSRLLDS